MIVRPEASAADSPGSIGHKRVFIGGGDRILACDKPYQAPHSARDEVTDAYGAALASGAVVAHYRIACP